MAIVYEVDKLTETTERTETEVRKEPCTFDVNSQSVLYSNNTSKEGYLFKFEITRLKSKTSKKEKLTIKVYDADNKSFGKITTTFPSLQEGLLELREYGVVVPRAVYGRVAKCIEQNYLKLEYIEEDFERELSEEIIGDIVRMFSEYVKEMESAGRTLEDNVKGELCYNIPSVEFAEILKDSEYSDFDITAIKKRLNGDYTICNDGRYDRTIYDKDTKKPVKVISFKKKDITTLPTLPV